MRMRGDIGNGSLAMIRFNSAIGAVVSPSSSFTVVTVASWNVAGRPYGPGHGDCTYHLNSRSRAACYPTSQVDEVCCTAATLEHIAYRVRLAASVAMDGSTFVAAFCTLTTLYAAAWVVIGKLMQGPPL